MSPFPVQGRSNHPKNVQYLALAEQRDSMTIERGGGWMAPFLACLHRAL
jgi:hypothetical protein